MERPLRIGEEISYLEEKFEFVILSYSGITHIVGGGGGIRAIQLTTDKERKEEKRG